jgi:hypothetical protein
MSIPVWTWPSGGAIAKGISLVPLGLGVAVADWTQPVLWPFSGGSFGSPITLSGEFGLSSAASDGSGSVYTTSWDGIPWHISSGGVPTSGAPLATGAVYVGTAFTAGSAFCLAASGHVYGSGGASLGSFPLPARYLAGSGTTLVAGMPSSGIGTMNANTGATGFIALPAAISTIACLALASGAPLAIGGWTNAAPLSGAAAAVLDPQNAEVMFAAASGNAIIWSSTSPSGNAWAQSQLVGMPVVPKAAVWRPDGTQVLVSAPTNNTVQVMNYTAGTLSSGQTLTVAGACSVAITGDSTHALVAQSGLAQITPISFVGSTWSTGTAITGVTGIVGVAAVSASGVIAASSGALTWYTENGGIWNFAASAALGFVPTALTVDAFGQAYVAGSGKVALAVNQAITATGSWTGGAPTSIAVQQGRIVMAVPADNAFRVFCLSASGLLSQQFSGALSLGSSVGLGLSFSTLFLMGSGSTLLYGFSGNVFGPTPIVSGAVGFYNGSSWTTVGLGIGNTPAAMAVNASGGVYVATQQNSLYLIASGGGVTSSSGIQTYSGQLQTAPLTPSSMLATASGVYMCTAIPGVLGQVA